MKRLLIALMAASLVLCAISFAAAQSANSQATVNAFQLIIPPGTTSGAVITPIVTATFSTVLALPISSTVPTASGGQFGFAGYSASASGGQRQHSADVFDSYFVDTHNGAHVTVSGFGF